ncbi:MAG: glycine--tRNA ligase subunit beta [Syntrophomonadaceae bacterium]|nr:glycine--tRNA ligase subunit beta [Syntrophomonadaceae bacterium]
MKRDLLLEIGVEEMPSAFMSVALADLKNLAEQKFTARRVGFTQVKSLGTPRRLVLYVEGLEEKQQDAVIENRGPKKASAYDQQGNPSKAALGFARGQGIDVADLEIRSVDGTEYIFAVKKELGGATVEVLPEILLDIINSLSFPKSMRWAYYQTRFARPIRWLLALYGDQTVTVQIENVKSSNLSYGHRFLAPEGFAINNIDEYFAQLRQKYVIVDHEERKKMIREQVQAVARQAGGQAMENDELLEEVTFLLEYPTAFTGSFSSSYLDVPPEVLTTSMIEHQRYFPVFDDQGRLMNAFIGVRNGTDTSLDIVRAGNERVLKARLEDALFFWKEDTSKALIDFVPGLEKVMFHERLGSIMDKVERLKKLAIFIGGETGLSSPEKLERAALLCKADLISNMVYEFPELQGIMGRYYALQSREDEEVAEAILEHYMPRFAGDHLPASPTGKVLALTEKIDNLTACFAIGIKPTGSQDPYALRRQALGMVNILTDMNIKIDLSCVIIAAYNGLVNVKTEGDAQQIADELMDFIRQRQRGILLDKGFAFDVIDAVLALSLSDIFDIQERVQAVQEFKGSARFEDFMVVFNRSHNLSKKWDSTAIMAENLEDESEKALYQQLLQVQQAVEKSIVAKDYQQALIILTDLRAALDRFFNAVMVMVEDEKLKAARLGILKTIAGLCGQVADFTKII